MGKRGLEKSKINESKTKTQEERAQNKTNKQSHFNTQAE